MTRASFSGLKDYLHISLAQKFLVFSGMGFFLFALCPYKWGYKLYKLYLKYTRSQNNNRKCNNHWNSEFQIMHQLRKAIPFYTCKTGTWLDMLCFAKLDTIFFFFSNTVVYILYDRINNRVWIKGLKRTIYMNWGKWHRCLQTVHIVDSAHLKPTSHSKQRLSYSQSRKYGSW